MTSVLHEAGRRSHVDPEISLMGAYFTMVKQIYCAVEEVVNGKYDSELTENNTYVDAVSLISNFCRVLKLNVADPSELIDILEQMRQICIKAEQAYRKAVDEWVRAQS